MAATVRPARSNRRVVYETLRKRILTLELPPGAALSENELAAVLGVSRTPVRESLILLTEEGLVQVFPQVGSFVSRVDANKVADAQFIRESIELASLEDIPAQPPAELVVELHANLERQHSPDIDVEEFFALDEQFHQGLLGLGGHASVWPTVVAAKGHLDRARRLGLQANESTVRFADEHAAVLTAVLDRGPAAGPRPVADPPTIRLRRHREDPQTFAGIVCWFRLGAGPAQRRGVAIAGWCSRAGPTGVASAVGSFLAEYTESCTLLECRRSPMRTCWPGLPMHFPTGPGPG